MMTWERLFCEMMKTCSVSFLMSLIDLHVLESTLNGSLDIIAALIYSREDAATNYR